MRRKFEKRYSHGTPPPGTTNSGKYRNNNQPVKPKKKINRDTFDLIGILVVCCVLFTSLILWIYLR